MEYFFTFETALPTGVGFMHWSLGHIVWLILIIASAAAGSAAYSRASEFHRRLTDKIIGAVMLLLEVLWNGVLFAGGNLKSDMLPLHLCAISIFMYIIYTFTGIEWIGQYIYCLGMPGAVCALLFPDWSMYPLASYYCISSFTLHGLLIVYGCMLLASGRVAPRLKKLLRPMAFLLCCAGVVYIFNLRFHTNYMFLMSPSKGSPLEFISAVFGRKLYLLGFFLLLLAVEVLLYLPWEVSAYIKRKKTA